MRFLFLLFVCSFFNGIVLAQEAKLKRLLIVAEAQDGHPAGSHEFVGEQKLLAESLAKVPGLEVTTSFADKAWTKGPDLLDKCDGVVLLLSQGGDWINAEPRRKEALLRLAKRGGGFAGMHGSIMTKKPENIGSVLQLLGACHGGPDRKYKFFETKVSVAAKDHPAVAGWKDVRIYDEFYYALKQDPQMTGYTPLLTIEVDKKTYDVGWAWQRPDGGRSFGFSGAHFLDHWRLPEYRRLFAQGVLWTLKITPPDKDFPSPLSAEDVANQKGERKTDMSK